MKATEILGIPSDLSNVRIRAAVHEVLLKIRDNHPNDFEWLQRLLSSISPHPNPIPGDLGECVLANVGATSEEFFASDDPYFEEKRTVYLVENELNPASQKGVIAHELGHVLSCDQFIDHVRQELVDDGEWASEAIADLYAMRWGFERELRILHDDRDQWHHRASIDELVPFLGLLDYQRAD